MSRIVGKSLGLLLAVVGLVYFALLIRLKVGGELAGDFKASLFLFGIGALLVGIGCASFFGSTNSSITSHTELAPSSDPSSIKSDEELRGILAGLCKEAMDGSLMIGEFHRRWPMASGGHEFVVHCFDDVEDCVEHMPASWQTGALASWRSFERKLVELDHILLTAVTDWDAMLRCRLRVGKRRDLSSLSLADEVNSCLNKE